MNNKEVVELAIKAILYEVSVTPKPGLVDRINSGAHNDMDFYTFMSSVSSISSGFYAIADASDIFDGEPKDLLAIIRPIGIDMEKNMFHHTNGINTHKGIIFSLGILVAATVHVLKVQSYTLKAVMDYVRDMTRELVGELDKNDVNSHGEKNYRQYGTLGIRGEVSSGFETVVNHGLRRLYQNTSLNRNDRLIEVLFSLMSYCDDSNIISRHSPDILAEIKTLSNGFLENGGMNQENAYSIVNEIDQQFIDRNISPGGSADLLAVTIYLGFLENIID